MIQLAINQHIIFIENLRNGIIYSKHLIVILTNLTTLMDNNFKNTRG